MDIELAVVYITKSGTKKWKCVGSLPLNEARAKVWKMVRKNGWTQWWFVYLGDPEMA